MSNVFSAGLDIHEMYNTNEERLRIIWTELQNAWIALYGTSLPTAAAINVSWIVELYLISTYNLKSF